MKTREIRTAHLSKSFVQGQTKISILKDISVSFKQGKSYAITGISGSGKSTLLQLLAGLDNPDSGSVYYNDRDLSTCTETELDSLHNKELGLVFQQPYLIKELSVIENIMLPGLIACTKRDLCKERALWLLNQVGLIQKTDEKPSTLSGGQQQRVALARALFNKPTFLIADEPTGNLDEATGHSIIDLLLVCQHELHMGLIISSHDQYVAQMMQQIYQVREGRLHELQKATQTFPFLTGNAGGILQERNG